MHAVATYRCSMARASRIGKCAAWSAVIVGASLAAVALLWRSSPRPSVWLLRQQVRRMLGDEDMNPNAEFVPDGISEHLDQVYDPTHPRARYDVFYPADAEGPLTTIFWVHGGGFIGGAKEPLRNYLRILASHGFTTVNVEYTHAPEATYPGPIVQLNQAIEAALLRAREFHIDPNRIVLAGDSAGAHMSAQAAMAIAQPGYAQAAELPHVIDPESLIGTVQFSGPYDLSLADFSNPATAFFMRTIMWAYSGKRDFLTDENFSYCNLIQHVTSDYPPTFVSTGPADDLLPQNEAWVDALERAGVRYTALFFDPATTGPDIGHEYQMRLAEPQAQEVMHAVIAFLRSLESIRRDVTHGYRDWVHSDTVNYGTTQIT